MNNCEFSLSDTIDIIEEVIGSGGEFRLFPKGVSMRPLLVQGRDSVILRKRKGIPAKKHDIAFYKRLDGQFVLHRVMKIKKDGTYVMCGDNQFAFEEGIVPAQIIGYVSDIYRGEKKFSVRALKYRAYVFVWTKMPIRRTIVWIRSFFKK